MYPQYPPYPYYSAGTTMSGGYVPATTSTYMPAQQVYYVQQYPPQPAVPPPPSANAPSVRRLPIKDPSTGLVIPVATSVTVEQAVAEYHRTSQVCRVPASHLVQCQARRQAEHSTCAWQQQLLPMPYPPSLNMPAHAF